MEDFLSERAGSTGSFFNSLDDRPLPPGIQLGPPVASTGPVSGALEVGSLIGHYCIRRRLGAGGMGVVYEALDNHLGRSVAIKVLRTNPNVYAPEGSLVTEARAAACLEHERFVRVYALDVLPSGQPYMVMEYLEGVTLRAWLSVPRPCASLAMVYYAICEGMAFAHKRGVVHRDLKPENVFLTSEGKVKILDLGLAGLCDAPRSSSIERAQLPRLGASCAGTPLYIAPEGWRGALSTPQSDVWALGVIMYETLSGGQHPFWLQGEPHNANVRRVLDGVYRPLSRIRPGVAASLDQIVKQALANNPADRFPDAGALLEALRGYMRSASIALPSASVLTAAPGERARTGLREHLKGGRAVGWAGLALLAAFSTELGQAPGLLLRSAMLGAQRPSSMAEIPGGSFLMGSTATEVRAAQAWCEKEAGDSRLCPPDATEREQPVRRIAVSGFLLDRTEVTNQEFAAWLNELLAQGRIRTTETGRLAITTDEEQSVLVDLYPSYNPTYGLLFKRGQRSFASYPGFANRPVTQVTWDGAQRYCQDHGKRLPTEAEWEFAARGAGQEGFRFPWGNDQPRCDGVVAARNEKNLRASLSGPEHLVRMRCADRGVGPSPVGTSPQDVTPQGVHDLAGNVSEWVQDSFLPRYPSCADCKDPVEPAPPLSAETQPRVFRGGSWALLLAHTRSASRGRYDGLDSSSSIGFRCAQDKKE